MNNEETLDDNLTRERASLSASDYQFPLNLKFNIGTLSNDLSATDSEGKYIGYVRQKLFKLRDHVQVFTDKSKKTLSYEVRADKIAGLKVCYAFNDPDQKHLGKVARKGAKSFWKANYLIYNDAEEHEFTIREENPWTKVWDSMLGEIPIINIFTGYFANPSYIVKDINDEPVVRLKKKPSFFSRKFQVDALKELKKGEDERVLLSLITMSLNERRRG